MESLTPPILRAMTTRELADRGELYAKTDLEKALAKALRETMDDARRYHRD